MLRRTLDALAALAVLGAVAAALVVPADAVQGDVQRLMYVHVPAAWVAFLAFGVTLLGSVGWLVRRTPRWDRLAASSAELGVLFTGMAIALGSIWGRPVWGVWWTWDPRLVSTALLFFVYVGYLALRRAIDDPVVRARRSALYGIVAFVQVPLVHVSVLWWRSLHQGPSVLRPDGPTLAPSMLIALLVGVAAFTLVFVSLLRHRIALAALADEVEATALQGDRLLGAAVTAPRFEEVMVDA